MCAGAKAGVGAVACVAVESGFGREAGAPVSRSIIACRRLAPAEIGKGTPALALAFRWVDWVVGDIEGMESIEGLNISREGTEADGARSTFEVGRIRLLARGRSAVKGSEACGLGELVDGIGGCCSLDANDTVELVLGNLLALPTGASFSLSSSSSSSALLIASSLASIQSITLPMVIPLPSAFIPPPFASGDDPS